ncbi:UDP-glucose 4-epimerase GalE [Billgrantia lactosivorans]|uniref:UDP-glucose 4-epimerase GalE n=1 Tax=Billgrantia lactosivorans TaxID=2185141 RepID=UPI000DABF1B8|nr:UDP-glucose 4-epimerase GalE [Halomonas lactosivorans]
MILVVGGCGYVGTHVVKALLTAGHQVTVLDDLSSGQAELLPGGELVLGDMGDRALLDELLGSRRVRGVVHLASLLNVAESVADPARYYRSNTSKSLTLLEAMVAHGVQSLVFSSSAAVYGEPVGLPIGEHHPCRPINPYGASKWMVERMLQDFSSAYGLASVSLRYFNAAGADPQGHMGECHEPETHLIPLAIQAALGRRPALVRYGRDYATEDGTCIRDFVHVEDLAAAHLKALDYLWRGGESAAFNLGSGRGYSVQEVLDSVRRVTGCAVPVRDAPRREGDPARLEADIGLAQRELGWLPRRSELDTIVRDAWRWEIRRREVRQGRP